jgi:hypothetical protein
MCNLSRRLAALERRLPAHPVESIQDARANWPRRFGAHSPANAEILERLRGLFEVHATTTLQSWPDAWHIAGSLPLLAGLDLHGTQWRYPASPTAVEIEARALMEEFCSAAGSYAEATGDAMPLPQLTVPRPDSPSSPSDGQTPLSSPRSRSIIRGFGHRRAGR